MIAVIFYAVIRLLSSIGAIAILNSLMPNEKAATVVEIYLTQTLVGAIASLGLQFDAYHAGINGAKTTIIPRIRTSTHCALIMTALIAAITTQIIKHNNINFKSLEFASIFFGALLFLIANIIGNYNVGLGNRGIATLAFISPNFPLLLVSIEYIAVRSDWNLAYLCTCIAINLGYLFIFFINRGCGPEISIRTKGRVGKQFASISQPLIIWLLMYDLHIGNGLSQAGYLFIQRVGDGVTSLTMLIAQMRHIRFAVEVMEGRKKGSLALIIIEISIVLIILLLFVFIVMHLIGNKAIYASSSLVIYALEATIDITKISLAIMSLLIMRFNAGKSTMFEITTACLVSFLITISGDELISRQLAVISGYLFLTIYGYRLLSIGNLSKSD